jgi:hypothetical protein
MKNKKPLRKIGTYFRELSIITIGVAITLAISAWLNYFNDKKNLKLYLNAVKLELEENKVHFENRRDFVQHSANYANYLKSTQINSLNSDSINKYMNIIYNYGSFPLQTSAFEMLKISGMMRLIDDKELLSLWKTYNELSDAKFMIEEIMRYKKEEAVREMHAGLSGAFNLPAPLYTFFAYDLPQTMLLLNEKAIVAIEKALLNFE